MSSRFHCEVEEKLLKIYGNLCQLMKDERRRSLIDKLSQYSYPLIYKHVIKTLFRL